MVAKYRDDEKLAFAQRLKNACDASPDCPNDQPEGRGRMAWIARQFPKMSPQAVRKWFTGESMPASTNIPRLAAILHADADWLMSGRPDDRFVPEFKSNEKLMDLIRRFPEIDEEGRSKIFHFAELLTLSLPHKND